MYEIWKEHRKCRRMPIPLWLKAQYEGRVDLGGAKLLTELMDRLRAEKRDINTSAQRCGWDRVDFGLLESKLIYFVFAKGDINSTVRAGATIGAGPIAEWLIQGNDVFVRNLLNLLEGE